jgi:CTP:molybdopterin cytidylyltransferase MocA
MARDEPLLPTLGAVVLAAGRGTRFGGRKLAAELDARPVLAHVLEAIRDAGPARTVVVLGDDAADLERMLGWSDETRVVNPAPMDGLSGSLRIGIAECLRLLPAAVGVFVVLGDQPRTSPTVMRALAAVIPDAMRAGAWAVVPRYADGGGANPALLLRDGLAHVPELRGDRGLSTLLQAGPGRTFEVPVAGSNPDIDTRADLAALQGTSGTPRPEEATRDARTSDAGRPKAG